jgi:hypothetical protein
MNTVGLVDSVIGCGTPPCLKSGYNFSYDLSTFNNALYWGATSVPVSATGLGATGTRFFHTNESGVIYFNPATAAPTTSDDAARTVTLGTGGGPLS